MADIRSLACVKARANGARMEIRALRYLVIPSLLALSACDKKAEPAKTEPAKTEPAKTEPAKTEPAKVEGEKKAEPAAAEPAKAEPAKAEPAPEAKAPEAPPIPEAKGLFECHKAATPPVADAKDPWALRWAIPACPEIPSTFEGITFGMDRATAETTGKAEKKFSGDSGYIYLGKSPFRLQTSFWFNEAGKVYRFSHKIDQKAFDLLKAGWGEPVEVVDGSDKSFRWYNPEAKIMAVAEPDSYDRANAETKEDEKIEGYKLYFVQYTPLTDLLGAEGIVSKAIIGKTVAELRTSFPDLIEETTAEKAKAELAAAGLDAETQAKAAALGAADAKVNLSLPPAATDEHFTTVHPSWSEGKIEDYSFELSHEKKDDLKNELLAQIAALLGKPTASKLEDGKPEYTFAGPNGVVVRVSPSILEDGWRVEVAAK